MSNDSDNAVLRILVVEDEALVARDIKSRLQQLGYEVAAVAHNPQQAITLAEETRPNLLLCDIHLKQSQDGIDVAEQVMAMLDIPVIFLTAYSDEDTVRRAKSVTPYGYVLKPVENPDLQIAIELAQHKFKVEHELNETRQLLATALHCLGDALIFIDRDGVISNINKEGEQLFECDKDQCIGLPWQRLFGSEIEPISSSIHQFLSKALNSESVTRLPPFAIMKPGGGQSLVDGIVGPIKKKGLTTGAVLIARELAEIHEPVESLPHASELTGDLSPHTITDDNRAFVLLLVNPDDIDQVTEIEDRDSVIQEISLHLNRAMRGTDLATHYGGAVFSASLPYTTIEEGSTIAEAILLDLSGRSFLHGRLKLSFSIGIAHYRPDTSATHNESPLELFRRANWALNLARQSGGNKVVIWRPNTDVEIVGNLDRQSGLFSADSGRDYRNMVLLWNTMNIVAKATDAKTLGSRLAEHFYKSFDLNCVAFICHHNGSLKIIASHPSLAQEDLRKTDLSAAAISQIENTANGRNLNTNIPGLKDNYCTIPLFAHGNYLGAVFIQTDDYPSILREQDLIFIKTLIDYASGPFTSLLPDATPITPVNSSSSKPGEQELLFQSPAMLNLMETIQLVAPTEATVLITGESGTGKELIARKIHQLSTRRDEAFVIVDCGAIVPSLIESELFGHTKGAFTGAQSASVGKLERANKGTIFLDEIGELPIDIQVKLLRVVQEKQYALVGSNEYKTVDTRIIAATNVDLEASVEAGSFRKDLYYRLNVFTVISPPLRERKTDIIFLAQHFLADYAQQYNKHIRGFNAEAVDAMQAYEWPGNVRELKNKLTKAVILCQQDFINTAHLELSDTPLTSQPVGADQAVPSIDLKQIRPALSQALETLINHCLNQGLTPPLGTWLEEDLISASLRLHNNVTLQAAETLKIPESTVRRKSAKIQNLYPTGQAQRIDHWRLVEELLAQWVANAKALQIEPVVEAQNLLLEHISRLSRKQSDAAALAGVSQPTYRRQIESLKLNL